MSKLILILSLTAVFCVGALANAFTPAQTRFAFRSCQNYLKLPRAEQRRRAERAGTSLEDGVAKCRWMIHRGLAQILRDEAVYNRWERGGGDSSDSGRPECSRSSDCPSSSYSCIAGSCQNNSSGGGCSSSGINSCPGTETCSAGVCR